MIALALLLVAVPPVIVADDAFDDSAITGAFGDARIVRATPAPDSDREQAVRAYTDAKKSCQAGRKLAVALENKKAIAVYEQALNQFETALAVIDDYAALRECLVDLGAAWLDDGRDEPAAAAFLRALMIDPALAIDERRYGPHIIKRFRRAQNELASAPVGSVTVNALPSGSTVLIDGNVRGATPVSIAKLLAGPHWLVVKNPNRRPFATRVTVRPSAVERIDVILKDPRGAAEIALGSLRGEDDELTAKSALSLLDGADRVITVARREKTVIARVLQRSTRTFSAVLQAESLPALAKEIESLAASAPVVIKESRERPRTHWAVAFLPLGIGQFVEKRPIPGALLLVTELGLLATNIACYAAFRSDRLPSGRFDDVGRGEALKWVVNVSFALLLAEIVGGAIDGELHR